MPASDSKAAVRVDQARQDIIADQAQRQTIGKSLGCCHSTGGQRTLGCPLHILVEVAVNVLVQALMNRLPPERRQALSRKPGLEQASLAARDQPAKCGHEQERNDQRLVEHEEITQPLLESSTSGSSASRPLLGRRRRLMPVGQSTEILPSVCAI